MRQYIRFFTLMALILLLSSGLVFGDENTLRLESRVVESFDGPGSGMFEEDQTPIVWKVYGSKFSTGNDLPNDDPGKYPKSIYAKETWPIDLFGVRPEDAAEKQALGIHAKFDRMGYNTIQIIPGEGEGESWKARAIALPGRVKTLDFWAWGAQYDYTIELYFMDSDGRKFRLVPTRMEDPRAGGSLNFTGWKNMFVNIPGHIRQAQKYKPSRLNLYLTKIMIYTHPEERVNDFYFYIDHIKVLSDFQETFFDGYDLANPEKTEEIWGGGE